ncbi:MAG: hypothetical protein ACOC5D_02095 [Thermoplasmatota archaeon]
MDKRLDKEIREVKKEMRKCEKSKRELKSVEEKLQQKKEKLDVLEENFKDESEDVEKLKSISISSFIHTVLGDKSNKLKKEKEEYLEAKMKYDSFKNTVSSLKEEKERLEGIISKTDDLNRKYGELLKEKKNKLVQSDHKNADTIIELTEKKEDLKEDIKEIQEAQRAANDLVSSIEVMLDYIKSAENWGTLDLLGGGLISTAQKHSKLDKAKRKSEDVQNKLQKFQIELSNVDMSFDMDLELSSFTKTADYIFDGLIVDWFVQSKISEAFSKSQQLKEEVIDITQKLEDREEKTKRKLEDVEEKRIDLIENS